MTEPQKNKVKQSFIAGSLTSSAGVFLSKLIGLFYVVPFKSIAGQSNMAFYSAAYTWYNVLLQISSAGLPFAVAAIVAKYVNKNDFKTVVLVRKLSTALLMVFGFVMAVIFILMSGPLAVSAMGSLSEQNIRQMQNTYVILSLALFVVPLLYSYRGYYQGMKELKSYADSQVIEQFCRVAALLFFGWLLVYVLHYDRINAIYTAVLATSIGSASALAYYIYFDKRHYPAVKNAARFQKTEAEDAGLILKELIAYGIPYLLVAILGNSQTLIDTQFFIRTNTAMGMNPNDAMLLLGIIETNCDKLTSIPQVLSIGFSAGVVPYMTLSLENRDWKGLNKNIEDCLDIVLYIALPICFCMCVLAEPIYYVMYGAGELAYGTTCLRWASLLGLVTTISPITNSMMLTLKFRKESLIYLGVGFAVKCITFFPLIKFVGYTGAIISSILCSATIIFLNLTKIKNKFDAAYARIFVRGLKMAAACLAMNGVFVLLRFAGLDIVSQPRLIALAMLAGYGILGILVYIYTTNLMKLPQAVFHMDLKQIANRFLHRGA